VELGTIKDYVLKHYGINLSAYKANQLDRRIESFVNRSNVSDPIEFVNLIKKDTILNKKFLDFLTINVSEFFRNKEMFDILEQNIKNILMPQNKTLKIWSAACSIGAEPYTLAMIMDRLTPGKRHNIIATDIDNTILETARNGIYTSKDIKNVDEALIKKYFIVTGDNYEINNEMKSRVIFKKHDLILDRYDTDFDLIICRNVVIYFTQDAKNDIYNKFYKSMKPGALLFVGATESIYNYRDFGFEKLSTFIYKKQGGN
jgi:chemotaxis protein methyltransferase CheR